MAQAQWSRRSRKGISDVSNAVIQASEPHSAALAAIAEKSLLRFITCGSVDDGKSTLIGRMLYEAGLVPEDQLETLVSESRKHGTNGDKLDFSLLVDGLAAEREQGITIDVAYRYFSTARRKFIVADTPGHEQYTRNMATGASTADLAILLVDARKGLLTQTRRHSLIVSMLGVKHVILAVNKMDLVEYSPFIFNAIESEFRAFAAGLGFASIACIPVSAREGDNVVKPSAAMSWHKGAPLLSLLETIETSGTEGAKPFRLPVQWVNRPNLDFRGFSGFVASGAIRPGDRVRALPSGVESTVERIVTYDGDLGEAIAGQSITLTLNDEIDISRGDVLSGVDEPPQVASALRARILWLSQQPLAPGRVYVLKIGPRAVVATLSVPETVIDINTGRSASKPTLALNEIGVATVSLDRAVAFDTYQQSRETGGFILIDRISNDTVAMGLIEAGVAPSAAGRSGTGYPASDGSLGSLEGISAPEGGLSALIVEPRELPWRSFAKAVSWRITGSIDTFVLALVFSGSVSLAAAIGGTEVLTKIVLYYLHERLWGRLKIGLRRE
ncbi:MAG: sulfate adenylyltransferase subunit CysN [Beijerinckiaceae bacterium]|nr:sulfate adenylyltransferase subunit CysN [Beijerinckiaceae bacterium]